MDTNEAELWRPIAGWPGYEVSSQGRVKCSRFHGGKSKGGATRIGIGTAGRTVRPTRNMGGYLQVNLCCGDRTKKRRPMAHRLVLEAFVGPCPEGLEACHNNGVRDDNRLSNLRWDTPAANNADKRLHGTEQTGSRQGRAKLTENDIPVIFRRRAEGALLIEIAREFGVSKRTIGRVLGRSLWSHVELPDAPEGEWERHAGTWEVGAGLDLVA